MSKKPRKEGDLCFIELGARKNVRLAVIKYVGRIEGKEGEWRGVEVIKGLGPFHGTGKNDGAVDGLEYFECEDGQGVFTRKVRGANNPKESGVITRAERIQKKVYRALEHKNAIDDTRGKKAALREKRRTASKKKKDTERQKLEKIKRQKTTQRATKKQIRDAKIADAKTGKKPPTYMSSRAGVRPVNVTRKTPKRETMKPKRETSSDEVKNNRAATARALMSTAKPSKTKRDSLKRRARPAPGRKSAKSAKVTFSVGDKVKCMNKNGQWERATIIRARPTNTYDIEWDKTKAVEKFKTPRVLRKVQGTDMETHHLDTMDNRDLLRWLRRVENGLLAPYAKKFNDGTDGTDILAFSKDDLKRRVPETAPRLWLFRCILHERKGSGFTEPDLSDAASPYSADEDEKEAFDGDDDHVTGCGAKGYRRLPGFNKKDRSNVQPEVAEKSDWESEICCIDPTSADRSRILKALRGNHEVTVLDSTSSPAFELPGYTLDNDDDPLTWRCNCPVQSTRQTRDGRWMVTFQIGDHPLLRGANAKENTQQFDDVWDCRTQSVAETGTSLMPTRGAAKPPGPKRGAVGPPGRPGRGAAIRNSQGTEMTDRSDASRPPSFGRAFGDSVMVDDTHSNDNDAANAIASPKRGQSYRSLPAQEGTIQKVIISGLSDVDNLLLSKQARKALLMSMRISDAVRPTDARGRDDKIVVEFERKINQQQVQELQSHLRTGFEEDVVIRPFIERRAPDGSDVIFEVSGRDFIMNKNEVRTGGGKLTQLLASGQEDGRIKLNDRSASRFALILDYYRRGFIRPGPDCSIQALVKELEWYDIPLSSIDKGSVLQQIPRLISIFEVDDRQLDEMLEKVVRDRRHTRDADHFKQQLNKNLDDSPYEVQEFIEAMSLRANGEDYTTVIRADGLDGELYKEFDISLRLRNMKTGGMKTVSFHMIAGEGYTMRILDKQIKRKDFADALRALLNIPAKYKDSTIEGLLELVSETMEYFCDDDEF